MNLRSRVALGLTAAGLLTVAPATAAFAGNAGDGSGYGTQPGYSTAITNSNGCAGAGAFGAFGTGFNFGNATSGHVPYPGNATNGNGADGPATGSNNSNLCGSPQGNP
jgi:hypothetical protein